MIAYLDSSILLRQILREPNRLVEWDAIQVSVSSELVRTECFRSLDRLRLQTRTSTADFEAQKIALTDLMWRVGLINLDRSVLDAATMPLPHALGTLDAIHLVTALAYRNSQPQARAMSFATHDVALARAARAFDFPVLGA